jgi:hypothetical protein
MRHALFGRIVWSVPLALAGLSATVSPSAASAASVCWSDAITDVDGDGPDVILGLRSYDLPGKPDAGAIVVYSDVGRHGRSDPNAPTAARVYSAEDFPGLTSQAGGRFGATVLLWRDAGDQDDADACADVLVGSPGHSVGGKPKAGQVYKLKGSPGGLSAVLTTYDEDALTGTGGAQAGAAFGSAIAAETLGMIAIGAPGRDLGGAADGGHVVRLNYLLSDQQPEVSVVRQGGVNSAGAAEAGDRFGEVLTLIPTGDGPILFIGVPHEDIGRAVDAGAVGMVPTIGSLTLISQDSTGAGGTAESGDRYGAALGVHGTFTDQPTVVISVGVPGEDVGSVRDAGIVGFAAAGLRDVGTDPVGPLTGMSRTIGQGTPRVPGAVEAGDGFGAGLAAGDFGADDGQLRLVVTSPAEDFGSAVDAGMLAMLPISGTGALSPGRPVVGWNQDSRDVPGVAERNDRFAGAVTSVELSRPVDDFDLVWPVDLVTVPGEDLAGTADAGLAYLGVAPGVRSVQLVPPVRQAGAGLGMVPMQTG